MAYGFDTRDDVTSAEDQGAGRRTAGAESIDAGEPLDPNSPVPLYAQLAARASAYIASLGEKGVGRMFPSENECIRLFRVSRPTVRQAISELEAQGLVRKERGRGVFICEPRLIHDISHVFEDDMQAARRKVDFKLLEHGYVSSPASVLEKFGEDTKRLYRVQRLRATAGRVLGIEVRFFPERFERFLTPQVLGTSDAFAILKLCTKADEVTSVNVVHSVQLDARDATLTGVPEGSLALSRETMYYVDGKIPVMYGMVTFLADRYQLRFQSTIDLRGRSAEGARR